jgi:oxygen-dependent protoporphyrinogen oxidase
MGRAGTQLVDDLVSAVLHGIYAGSARGLSVRAVMPALWDMEARSGGLLRSVLPRRLNARARTETPAERLAREEAERELAELETSVGPHVVRQMKSISVYSLPEGIETITRAMEKEVRALPNVEVCLDAGVQRASVRDDGMVQVSFPPPPLQHA